jgi:hypothetical protein
MRIDRPTFAEVVRNAEEFEALAEGKEPAARCCVWCLAPLKPSRTKPRAFCSERCRKRVARATPIRFFRAQTRADQLCRALRYKDAVPS